MEPPFDPYYKWFGIPPDEQPPNHYRLLGIHLFEDDEDVIRNASDQRMSFLKSFALSKHASLAEKLLNEVSAATICLLNPEKKQAYDEHLRALLGMDGQILDAIWVAPVGPLDNPFAVICPHCHRDIEYSLHKSGQIISCPNCNGRVQTPTIEEIKEAAAEEMKEVTSEKTNPVPLIRPYNYKSIQSKRRHYAKQYHQFLLLVSIVLFLAYVLYYSYNRHYTILKPKLKPIETQYIKVGTGITLSIELQNNTPLNNMEYLEVKLSSKPHIEIEHENGVFHFIPTERHKGNTYHITCTLFEKGNEIPVDKKTFKIVCI